MKYEKKYKTDKKDKKAPEQLFKKMTHSQTVYSVIDWSNSTNRSEIIMKQVYPTPFLFFNKINLI